MALMTPFVQTRLVDYFTRILEERTGTTISIGRVEFRPIESLILNDVCSGLSSRYACVLRATGDEGGFREFREKTFHDYGGCFRKSQV